MKIPKQTSRFIAVVLGLAFGACQTWALPKIKVLATGGTIAGAQASQAEAGYTSGKFSVDDLIKAVPQLKEVAESRHSINNAFRAGIVVSSNDKAVENAEYRIEYD